MSVLDVLVMLLLVYDTSIICCFQPISIDKFDRYQLIDKFDRYQLIHNSIDIS